MNIINLFGAMFLTLMSYLCWFVLGSFILEEARDCKERHLMEESVPMILSFAYVVRGFAVLLALGAIVAVYFAL